MTHDTMRRTIYSALVWLSMLTQCGSFPPAPAATTPLPQATAVATTAPVPTPVEVILPHTTYTVSADDTRLTITTDNQSRQIILPNGIQQLALGTRHIAVRDNNNDVSIIDLDSKRKEPLPMACDSIAWHIDADTLWCVAYGDLYRVNPTQSQLVALAPAGYHFVHAMHRPSTTEIWAISADDAGMTQFCQITPALSCIGTALVAQWRPDGALVAIADTHQLTVMDAIGLISNEVPLTDVTTMSWLDDNTLFVRTDTETFTYQIRTRILTNTTKQIPATHLLGVQ